VNYLSVYNEIVAQVFGDTTPPTTTPTRLYGTEGLIARKRKEIQDEHNYWFMEKSWRLPIIDGVNNYDLPTDFKEELRLRFEDIKTGDYRTPLTKLSLDDIDQNFRDRDADVYYPSNYYLDFDVTLHRRQINLFPKPKGYTEYKTTLSASGTSIGSTAFSYSIDGEEYDKIVAITAFSAANTINASAAVTTLWGAWLVQINATGTISTKPAGGLANQIYTSEDEALSNKPEVDSGNYPMGYVTIQNKASTAWTANTDDLIAGSDCKTVNFYSVVSILDIRYFRYADALSSVQATMEITEDTVSKECANLLIWMCVLNLAQIRYDGSMVQIATQEIEKEKSNLFGKDWSYRSANSNRIPYKSI
jgi:hypothetical protein